MSEITIYDPQDYWNKYRDAQEALKILRRKSTRNKAERARIQKLQAFIAAFEDDQKKNAYKYFVPIAKLDPFIYSVGSLNYMISLLSAGNAIGKTTTSIVTIAQLIWFSGNKYFNYPLFIDWPFLKRIRIVSSPTAVKENIIPAIKKWFPYGRWRGLKAGKQYISKIETDNGWLIDLMTYEQHIDEFEGVTLGLFWLDEPPPYGIYTTMISRLREGGKGMITATPLDNAGWFREKFYNNPRSVFLDKVPREKQRTGDVAANRIAVVFASVEDACIEHGERGFLKHENIENMISEWSEEEKAARLHGKLMQISGIVFKNFDRSVHVIEPFEVDPSKYTVYMALDPHDSEKHAMLWLAVDRDGTFYVVNESFKTRTIDEIVAEIRKIESENNYHVVARLIDPLGTKGSMLNHDVTLQSELAKHNLIFEPAEKRPGAREDARILIRSLLDFKVENNELVKPPKLYFFKTCTRTIWEMESWHYPRGNRKRGEFYKKKPVDKDDHMIENLGRIILSNPVFIEPKVFSKSLRKKSDFKKRWVINTIHRYI